MEDRKLPKLPNYNQSSKFVNLLVLSLATDGFNRFLHGRCRGALHAVRVEKLAHWDSICLSLRVCPHRRGLEVETKLHFISNDCSILLIMAVKQLLFRSYTLPAFIDQRL